MSLYSAQAVDKGATTSRSRSAPLLLAAMAFSMPSAKRAGKGYGKGVGSSSGGRPQWSAGQKLWNTQVLSGNFGKAVVGSPTHEADTEWSSAAMEGLKEPAAWIAPEMLVNKITCGSSEMVNRPGVGMSELGAAVILFHTLLEEGRKKQVLHDSFVQKWLGLYEEQDLVKCAKMLNTQDYPEIQRSDAAVLEAVKGILSFGNTVREQWEELVWIFGAFSGASTCLSWTLQLGALTIPGAWASALKDVPKLPGSNEKLKAAPTKGKLLAAVLSDCVSDLAVARKGKTGPKILTKSTKLTFSSSEESAEEPDVPPKLQKSLTKAVDSLLQCAGPYSKAKALSEAVSSAFEAVANLSAKKANELCDVAAVKAHVQCIKKRKRPSTEEGE